MPNPRGITGKKGKPKTGGRKKGTKNKPVVSPITLDIIATLKEKNFEPAAEMVKLYAEAMAAYNIRKKNKNAWGAGSTLDSARHALDSLMRYVYPTRKSVEVSGPNGGPVSFIDFVTAIELQKKGENDSSSST